MEIALAYIPCSSPNEASALAKLAIEANLAICANILPQMKSLYRWNDKIEESNESLLLIKHQTEKFELLKDFIREKHSYDTPCITQIHLNSTNSEYLHWAKFEA